MNVQIKSPFYFVLHVIWVHVLETGDITEKGGSNGEAGGISSGVKGTGNN